MTHAIPRFVRLRIAAALAVGVLAGCWDGGDGDDNTAAATVPASAGESSASFVSFLRDLPNDDSAEPLSLEGFTAPIDDTAESTPLS